MRRWSGSGASESRKTCDQFLLLTIRLSLVNTFYVYVDITWIACTFSDIHLPLASIIFKIPDHFWSGFGQGSVT